MYVYVYIYMYIYIYIHIYIHIYYKVYKYNIESIILKYKIFKISDNIGYSKAFNDSLVLSID